MGWPRGRLRWGAYCVILLASVGLLFWGDPAQAVQETLPAPWPWWAWPIVLFFLTAVLGVLGMLAGIGGSVLFVPVVSGFLPFLHIDFIRGAGLMVALAGALSAGPGLIRQNLAHLRLAIPISLMASFASIFGAMIGLALPANVVQLALGLVILAMSGLMVFSKTTVTPGTGSRDPIAAWLNIRGSYSDPDGGEAVPWEPRRMGLALLLFSGVGLMAGMFGMGAGWANVPVLTMVMGVPLKVAVGTSFLLLAINGTSAAWIYLNRGALLPLIVIPAVLGIMLGAQIGTRLLVRVHPAVIRKIVIVVLLLAGSRALLKGFGI